MNPENKGFLDKNTLIAVALVAALWVGWQIHLQNKYPDMGKKTPATQVQTQDNSMTEEVLKNSSAQQKIESNHSAVTNENSDEMAKSVDVPEQKEFFEDENWSFIVSSKGMGIQQIILKNYSDRKGNPVIIGAKSTHLPYETSIVGKNAHLDFDLKTRNGNTIVGIANYGSIQIEKTLKINSKKYLIETEIEVTKINNNFPGLVTHLSEDVKIFEGGSFFMPRFERQELFVLNSEQDEERIYVEKEEPLDESLSKVRVAALGTQYFTQAIVDKSDVMPRLRFVKSSDNKTVAATLSHSQLTRSSVFKVHFLSYAGPKSYTLMKAVDENLASSIDFGFFSSIAKPILKILRWFYGLVGNWGFAIILLTILVRVLVLPANILSYRSMRVMQKIQPKIKALRAKYKDEPQKLNQEMMVLMKSNKANPLGGCFPVLLQFPIFIALYQVLGQSIELYQAPFIMWIEDLSLKDPFYVLPVLMGITIFLQQKLTPNTMDPAQAKILMFMPIIFTFFMVALPSGLTLYIFVSGLFAVVQQYFFMKKNSTTESAT